jgi:hypothetical protein
MTTGTREVRRQALIKWIAQQRGSCHVTAMLPSGASRAYLEDRLREWVIRVNRAYLGRDWYTPRYASARMTGIVFFEQGGGGWHAHMIIEPPKGASILHFLLYAPYHFKAQPDPLFRRFFGKPVAAGGKMYVQKIGPTPQDLQRVAGYASKATQYRDDPDASAWKFLELLSPCKGCR